MLRSSADRSAPLRLRRSRHGAHFFDRDSGLNVLVNEVACDPATWAEAPRYVSIALTNACELRCPFCYAPKTPGRLSADMVLDWAKELDAAGCLGLGFGGGEPTAHPRFADICEQVSTATTLAVTFTTHGHRITDALAGRLRGHVHFVRVSVDGIGDRYESIRGRPFVSVRQQLKTIRSVSRFGINSVITEETIQDVDAICSFAEEVGASELLLLPELPVGRIGNPGLSQASMQRLTEWVAGSDTDMRLTIAASAASPEMGLAEPFGPEPALEGHAHIDATGVLRPNAYSPAGVKIEGSLIHALSVLTQMEATDENLVRTRL